MKLQTAVLDDTRLYWRDAKGNLAWVPMVGALWIEHLCEEALKHGLHTIWVLPGSTVSKQVLYESVTVVVNDEEYDLRIKKNDDGVPVFGSVKRTQGTWDEKRLVNFAFPEHDSRWMNDSETWALADVEKPIELLNILLSTEKALAPSRVIKGCLEQEPFHLAWSPGYSGMDLIKKTVKLYGHMGWMKPADVPMWPAVSEPGGFNWKRGLSDRERDKKYIHFFDRNGQFLAAATGAELGEGTPDYCSYRHLQNLKLPGVWRIKAFPPKANNLGLLPPLPTGDLWVYTPTIEAYEALGYTIGFIEGYQWPVHHRTLQGWAKHCWDARLALKGIYGAGSPQEHLAKMIPNRGLGWLDLGIVRKEKREGEPTNRPDWYNMIRSLARYRMVLKIKEFSEKGYFPVMIVADNIAYVSDDPNPETAIPGLMIRKDQLGGFKHDGTYLLDEVLPLIDSLDPNKIRQEVKKLQKEVYQEGEGSL